MRTHTIIAAVAIVLAGAAGVAIVGTAYAECPVPVEPLRHVSVKVFKETVEDGRFTVGEPVVAEATTGITGFWRLYFPEEDEQTYGLAVQPIGPITPHLGLAHGAWTTADTYMLGTQEHLRGSWVNLFEDTNDSDWFGDGGPNDPRADRSLGHLQSDLRNDVFFDPYDMSTLDVGTVMILPHIGDLLGTESVYLGGQVWNWLAESEDKAACRPKP